MRLGSKQTLGKKFSYMKTSERIAKGGVGGTRGGGQDFTNVLKRAIFSSGPCITIHHWASNAPYAFKAVDCELDIDRTIQINYLLGLY